MIPTKLETVLLVATLGLTCGAASADAPSSASADAAVKPWVKENDCSWWLSREDGHSLRASIEPGENAVTLTFGDPVFNTWPEAGRPKVELRFNRDPKRRVATTGWATHGDGFAMFGIDLNAGALKKFGGATTIELRRRGKTAITLPLAATPSADELVGCIPPPRTGPSDSE